MSQPDPLPAPARLLLRRRIDWIDTDAAGIYHWTTAFRLAESAEAALHTALGIEDVTFGATPRVAVTADFRRSLRFNDPVAVELKVEGLGHSSVRYALSITGADGVAVAGHIIACFIDRSSGRATAWPHEIRERLAAGGLQEEVRCR